ncbi:hypothetical protein B0H14DRAFT_3125424 [Mycena olivaceomarginata]|nr:hypothetical protein B0H14DRAFT_3125424 [Mycena olivaceomarginata]
MARMPLAARRLAFLATTLWRIADGMTATVARCKVATEAATGWLAEGVCGVPLRRGAHTSGARPSGTNVSTCRGTLTTSLPPRTALTPTYRAGGLDLHPRRCGVLCSDSGGRRVMYSEQAALLSSRGRGVHQMDRLAAQAVGHASRGSGPRGGQGQLWDSAGGRPAGCVMGKVVAMCQSGQRQGVQWTGGREPVTRKRSAGRTGSGSRGAMGQVVDVWLPAGAASEQAVLEQPASSGQAAAGSVRRAAVWQGGLAGSRQVVWVWLGALATKTRERVGERWRCLYLFVRIFCRRRCQRWRRVLIAIDRDVDAS